MTRTRAVYQWRDGEGKRAEVRVYFTGPQTHGAIVTRAVAMASAFEAVSDARLVSVTIEHTIPFTGSTPAEPGSDRSTYALLFYRNELRVASIRVPSPGRLLTEVAGPYAGVRYTRDTLQLSGLLVTVEDIASGLVDSLGRPYPSTFSVGSRVQL